MSLAILAYYAVSLSMHLSFPLSQGTQASPPIPPAETAELKQETQQVEALMPTLADRGAALFLLAHDYAQLGDIDKGLSFLKQCIELDEGFDPESDPAFAPLKGVPEFQKLIERVHRRYPPVHRAHVAFTIEEKELIPEGVAFDGGKDVLYMGSLNLHKIVKINAKNGDVSDFVASRQYNLGPICGMKVEPSDGSVWANVCPDSGTGAELVHFDSTGKLLERFSPPTPDHHLFNDLVLRGKNEIYLTDSLANRVYRVDRRSRRLFEVPLARRAFYPNGIALSEDGTLLYIADAFGILLVDLRNNRNYEVKTGASNTLSGGDGLYWYRNSLVAVQNSLGSARVAQLRLSPDGLSVSAVVTLEYRSNLVVLPTTGAIDGSKFYFMSNTQVDKFKDDKIVDPAKLEPVHISVLELQD